MLFQHLMAIFSENLTPKMSFRNRARIILKNLSKVHAGSADLALRKRGLIGRTHLDRGQADPRLCDPPGSGPCARAAAHARACAGGSCGAGPCPAGNRDRGPGSRAPAQSRCGTAVRKGQAGRDRRKAVGGRGRTGPGRRSGDACPAAQSGKRPGTSSFWTGPA